MTSYVDQANTGDDVFVTSRSVSKPSGVVADDVGVFWLHRWHDTGSFPAVTAPAGAVLRGTITGTNIQTLCYLHRVSAETSFAYSWTGSRWAALGAEFTNGVDPGLDLSAVPFQSTTGNGTSITTLTLTTVDAAFLAWSVNTLSGGSAHTPPTSFTEVADFTPWSMAYRISPGDGSQSASGAALVSSTDWAAGLVALAPAAGGGSVTGDASLAGTGTLSATGVVGKVGDASLAGVGTLSASGVKGLVGGAALAGTGTLSSAGVLGKVGAASLAGTGTLSGGGVRGAVGNASLAGAAVLTAAEATGVTGDASLAGAGTLTASGSVGKTGGAVLTGLGTFTADGQAGALMYLFRTPTVDEGPVSWANRLFYRYKLTRGISILEGPPGTYRARRYPTQDEIAASAPHFYQGGHEYLVDDATKAALIAAGVGVTEANFTLSPQ